MITRCKYPPLIIKAKKGNAVKYSNNYSVIDADKIGTNIRSIIFSEAVEIKRKVFLPISVGATKRRQGGVYSSKLIDIYIFKALTINI